MLSRLQTAEIRNAVEKAAVAHLNAKDVDTALSHFVDDVIAVSNTKLFNSREALSAEIHEYYKILKTVNYAYWKDIHIHVISAGAATFTATFDYGFTSTDGTVTDLEGVWTALFILVGTVWKIRLRHESFEQK